MCPAEAKVQKNTFFSVVYILLISTTFFTFSVSLTFSITPKANKLFNLPLLNLIGSMVECNQVSYITKTVRKVP